MSGWSNYLHAQAGQRQTKNPDKEKEFNLRHIEEHLLRTAIREIEKRKTIFAASAHKS